MTNFLVQHIEWGVAHAHLWGFLIVFILMAIESSFIPFPSEVTMIPAGFLAFRGALTFGNPVIDLIAVVLAGLLGSLAGAFFNYYLALILGRPFLYRWGKYLFMKPKVLERAEEIFREYGDAATFVCRLLPAIRQLISIPAGFSKMSIWRFTFFTGLGAGIWTAILACIGYYLGHISKDMSYVEIVDMGKNILLNNYIWIILFVIAVSAIYLFVHIKIMKPKESIKNP